MSNPLRLPSHVLEEALSLLKRKLDDTQFPDEINDTDWAYGSPLANIRRLTERWRDGYDWRAHERELNALPMFTRPIEVQGFGELSVHYVHQKSFVKAAIPLLFSMAVSRLSIPLLSVFPDRLFTLAPQGQEAFSK